MMASMASGSVYYLFIAPIHYDSVSHIKYGRFYFYLYIGLTACIVLSGIIIGIRHIYGGFSKPEDTTGDLSSLPGS